MGGGSRKTARFVSAETFRESAIEAMQFLEQKAESQA
jgi:hypothetical protein